MMKKCTEQWLTSEKETLFSRLSWTEPNREPADVCVFGEADRLERKHVKGKMRQQQRAVTATKRRGRRECEPKKEKEEKLYNHETKKIKNEKPKKRKIKKTKTTTQQQRHLIGRQAMTSVSELAKAKQDEKDLLLIHIQNTQNDRNIYELS